MNAVLLGLLKPRGQMLQIHPAQNSVGLKFL